MPEAFHVEVWRVARPGIVTVVPDSARYTWSRLKCESPLRAVAWRIVEGCNPELPMPGFTAAMAVGTCLLFGLLPALRATQIAPAAAMRAGGRGTTAGRERYGLRRA